MLTPVKAPELILFTKQFRTMFNAGVAMINMLEILEAQTENPKLRRILGKMHQDIKEGASLYEAFNKHPKVFSPLYCSMIRAGETSGALPEVLDALEADHDYLTEGDVFTEDLIETWIDWKREEELKELAFRPHPYEFTMYFDF